MEQIASLRSCLGNDGNFDPSKFAQYRNQRCQYFDEDEEEEVVVPKKRKFAHRHYEGYDPQSALCSEWYDSYVKNPEKQRTVTFHTQFRRRIRVPYKSFRDIVAEACGRTGYTGPTGRTGPRHDPPDPSAYSILTSLHTAS